MTDVARPAFIHGYDIELTQGEDWAIGFRCLPRALTGERYLADTTGYSAAMTIRRGDPDGTLVLDAGGYVSVGFTPPAAARNTAYGAGQQVTPVALNGWVYACAIGGTTDAGSEPIWPAGIGQAVADGTVTWQCVRTDNTVVNVSVAIPAIVTANLADWGRGSWALSVRGPYGESWFYVDGMAILRKSSNV